MDGTQIVQLINVRFFANYLFQGWSKLLNEVRVILRGVAYSA